MRRVIFIAAACLCSVLGGSVPASAACNVACQVKERQTQLLDIQQQLRIHADRAQIVVPAFVGKPLGRDLKALTWELGRHRRILVVYKSLPTWVPKLSADEPAPTRDPAIPHYDAWICIHRHEGAWDDPGEPYWGGLQMDLGFQRVHGKDLYARKGTADHWTPREQMIVAERAFKTRGFTPWPNTARRCGLL